VTGNSGRDEGVDLGRGVLRALARSRLRIAPTSFDKRDVHVHVPDGATPKDGPSAGVAMATVWSSMLTAIAVRTNVAMTARSRCAVACCDRSGLKGKLLRGIARARIKEVLIPRKNAKDLVDCRTRGRAGWKSCRLAHGGGARPGAGGDSRSRSSGMRRPNRPLSRSPATTKGAGMVATDPAHCATEAERASNPPGIRGPFVFYSLRIAGRPTILWVRRSLSLDFAGPIGRAMGSLGRPMPSGARPSSDRRRRKTRAGRKVSRKLAKERPK